MMTETTEAPAYEKFLPEGIPPTQQPFWDSLKEHAVKVQRCADCGRYRYIPKEICPNCYSENATWTEISGHGIIYTFTVVHRAPTPAYQAETPYALVHATMDEGFRMIARLRTDTPESVAIGQPIRVAYEDATPEYTLLMFEPA